MSSQVGAFAKHFRCNCCNNPWNLDTLSESQSSIEICGPCLGNNQGFSGIDPSNFDDSVSPRENFYLWSNGGWKRKNPIPAEYSSWNTFIVLRDMNLERLKVILDELGTESDLDCQDPDIKKLKDFFSAFMNEELIQQNGLSALQNVFDVITGSEECITSKIAQLHSRYGVPVFFNLYSAPDKTNSDHSICSIHQAGLGMPDRDYYLDADKVEKRQKYVSYIRDVLFLLGQNGINGEIFHNGEKCEIIAKEILEFEKGLAMLHLTRTQSRDPKLTYNKMSVSELSSKSMLRPLEWNKYLSTGVNPKHKFDWSLYFQLIGKPVALLGDVNVASVNAVTQFGQYLDSDILRNYMLFHVINSFAPHLSPDFVQAHFQFHEKELKGTAEILPRWKRGLQSLESSLGDALGKLYVAKHFPLQAKTRALEVVEAVRDSLRERLLEVAWMSNQSKTEAIKKMERFRVKIGYPDVWRDYSKLMINGSDHISNIIESRTFDFCIELGRMNAPTDKERWFMTPQTVNAYYHPSLNEIVFPAAILQPPFFDAVADEAVQYGSLGAVVGHEMTHGFDDQGRKYDYQGNLRDWWAKEDGEEYERRADVMIKQAEAYQVHGLHLNGKLTCGENIADLGGVKLALRALKKRMEGRDVQMINGLTPVQRFFLAWSQSWRENVKKERAIQLLTLDPHGPNELRCNGTLSNIQEFFEAFHVTSGDKMYREEHDRVDIW